MGEPTVLSEGATSRTLGYPKTAHGNGVLTYDPDSISTVFIFDRMGCMATWNRTLKFISLRNGAYFLG